MGRRWTRQEIDNILRRLPSREPSGSPQNRIREFMTPLLRRGLSRREAEKQAREKMQTAGLPGHDCVLRYRKNVAD